MIKFKTSEPFSENVPLQKRNISIGFTHLQTKIKNLFQEFFFFTYLEQSEHFHFFLMVKIKTSITTRNVSENEPYSNSVSL